MVYSDPLCILDGLEPPPDLEMMMSSPFRQKPQKSAGSVSLCRPGSEKTTLNRCEGRSFSESCLDLKILWGTCKF